MTVPSTEPDRNGSSAVVRRFCESVSMKDIDRLRPLLTDDVVYHNIPMEPANGLEATLDALSGLFAMFETIEFKVLNLASEGDVVLTERVDILSTDTATAPVPVMGIFEVRDGRISAWRDYFDLAQVGRLLGGG